MNGAKSGAIGACFGENAEGVGGVWSANSNGSNDNWAIGEFHGQR